MSSTRKTNAELVDENQRLRAQVAQLQDRLDHLAEHGPAAKAQQQSEALHNDIMAEVADVVLIANDAGRLAYVSPNAQFIFGQSPQDILKRGRVSFLLPGELFDPDVLEQRGEIPNVECEIRDAIGRARSLLVNVRRIDRHGSSGRGVRPKTLVRDDGVAHRHGRAPRGAQQQGTRRCRPCGRERRSAATRSRRARVEAREGPGCARDGL